MQLFEYQPCCANYTIKKLSHFLQIKSDAISILLSANSYTILSDYITCYKIANKCAYGKKLSKHTYFLSTRKYVPIDL